MGSLFHCWHGNERVSASITETRAAAKIGFLFGLSFGAAILCIFVRAALILQMYPVERGIRGAYSFLKTLLFFSFYDILAVGLVFAGSALLVAAFKRWSAARWALTTASALLLAGLLFLALASLQTVPIYRWPLTVQLIRYSRFLTDLTGTQYVFSLIPGVMYAVLIGALCLFILSGLLFARLFRSVRVSMTSGLVLAATVIGAGGVYASASMRALAQREDEYMFRNAAAVLLQSMATSPFGGLSAAASDGKQPEPPVFEPRRAAPLPSIVPKNIVMFVMESTGALYLDAYGASYGVMPNLDRLLGHSVVIDTAYAPAPSSTVALHALVSGSVPVEPYQGGGAGDAPAKPSFVAELKRQGLRTGFFASGIPYTDELQFLSSEHFDQVRNSRQIKCERARFVDHEENFSGIDNFCALMDLFGWVDADNQKPFFAILWNYQTHYPYFASSSQRTFQLPDDMSSWQAQSITRYLNALHETDAALAELVRQLQLRGLSNSTLIVVMGDHGEAFGQHGLGGHGTDIYEEAVRIPVIFLHPGFEKKIRYDGLFSQVDLAPTISRMLGYQPSPAWKGIDIVSGQRNPRVFFFSDSRDAMVGYRQGDMKWMLRMRQPQLTDLVWPGISSSRELYERYDLKADPGERHNLGVSDPEAQHKVKQALARWVKSWAQ